MGDGYGELACVVRVQSVTWAAMVGCPCDWCCCFVHPLTLVSRAGVTLAFDSSPIKGDGEEVGLFFCPSTALSLWIADQVRNDGHNSQILDKVQNDGGGAGSRGVMSFMAKSWFYSPFR